MSIEKRLHQLENVLREKNTVSQEQLVTDYIDTLTDYFQGNAPGEDVEASFKRMQENKGAKI